MDLNFTIINLTNYNNVHGSIDQPDQHHEYDYHTQTSSLNEKLNTINHINEHLYKWLRKYNDFKIFKYKMYIKQYVYNIIYNIIHIYQKNFTWRRLKHLHAQSGIFGTV